MPLRPKGRLCSISFCARSLLIKMESQGSGWDKDKEAGRSEGITGRNSARFASKQRG